MGGNALTLVKTERKNSQDYHSIVQKVTKQLNIYCDKIGVIPSYYDKESYGDADILVIVKDNVDISKIIQQRFTPTQIVKNDKCYSFDFENFQIDIICTTHEHYQASYDYFSYNDLGNLVGRIAYQINLKYGHKGLYLRLDNKSQRELLISRNTAKNLTFLGFNSEQFYKGFKTQEDIFKYVIESKYFNSSYFKLENLNHINRTRNRKRKTYMSFLEYLENNNIVKSNEFNLQIQDIIDFFPESNILDSLENIKKFEHHQRVLAEKFNGKKIIELTGLQNKQLGNFIQAFKHSKTNFAHFIEITDTLSIDRDILNFYDTYKA
jgi:hypothetical protein